jgi:hypothetical protein
MKVIPETQCTHYILYLRFFIMSNKGNNKITELRTILQRENQNS